MLADLVDRDDIFVLDLRDRSAFPQKPLSGSGIIGPGREHCLDRHIAVELFIVCKIDPPHAAFPQQFDDAMPADHRGRRIVEGTAGDHRAILADREAAIGG